MRTIKLLSFLFFLSFFAFDSFSQADDKSYVIQIATFGSWEDFAKNEKKFYTNTGTADNNIYAEKVGKRIKVYLYDSYQGGVSSFYPGTHLDEVLKIVQANPHFKGAFRRSDVKWQNLTDYGTVFEKYRKKEVPEEFSTKGGNISTTSSAQYKIQLAVFKEQKSNDYIADNYGLSKSEKDDADNLLSYDFTTVKKDVCRRYYFGQYDSKADALAKKKALEKKTKRKLLLVKI